MIVVLVDIAEIEEWIRQGWTAALVPRHPVQRAYGKVRVWRAA